MATPAFAVSQPVWFKKAGSTPYVTGDATDAGKAVGVTSSVGTGANMLGGRGKSAITFTPAAFGLGTAQGVPQIAAADFPTPLDSQVVVSGTYNTDGKNVRGVLSQITTNNPFTPGINTVDGQYDEPTPVSPTTPNNDAGGSVIDEGLTDRAKKDTAIRTIDPNVSYGRVAGITAEGIAQDQPNTQEFTNIPVDLKTAAKKVGVRTPSVQQEAGIVIQVVQNVTLGTKSPDGTNITKGNMYWVNWGPPVASNPHKIRWGTKNMRVTLHAEEDLLAV